MNGWERLLRHERAIVALVLAALVLLAWIYLWRGAGMGMTALEMTRLTLFPHTQGEPMPGMQMPAITWVAVALMWWVMMIAMMLPSAAPIVLLHARVLQNTGTRAQHDAYFLTACLVAGYLAVWLLFSVAAAALQYVLQNAKLISEMMLWSQSAVLSAVVLAAAGVYQLSPLKQTCLKHCRGPIEFLTRHWRPGRIGAFVMGLDHGMWCVSCCWMLMALLFVGGAMNLAWIVLLAVLVLIEKVAPFGVAASRITGWILIAWSLATLAASGK